jgi:hypothetical protein
LGGWGVTHLPNDAIPDLLQILISQQTIPPDVQRQIVGINEDLHPDQPLRKESLAEVAGDEHPADEQSGGVEGLVGL